MPWLSLVALLGAIGLPSAPAGERPETSTVADVVVLRDGQEVYGQVIEPAPAGYHLLALRRAWAVRRLPEWASRWQEVERLIVQRARRQRRDRLGDWGRERAGPADALSLWIERERARLARLDPPPTPLLPVYLGRGEVRSIVRRPEATARLLRLGWLLGLGDVETLSEDELEAALRRRGVRLDPDEAVSIEPLLPVLPESEPRWRVRRAATEVFAEPALRLIDFRGLILPEHESEAPEGSSPWPQARVLDSPAALAAFRGLLTDTPPENPLAPALDAAAGRGRVGMLVTRVEISDDLDRAAGAVALWVRQSDEAWTPFNSERAARAVEPLPGGDETALRGDTPIPMALMVLESVAGHPPANPDETSRRLAAGVAADRAGRQARRALARRLELLALPSAPRR